MSEVEDVKTRKDKVGKLPLVPTNSKSRETSLWGLNCRLCYFLQIFKWTLMETLTNVDNT